MPRLRNMPGPPEPTDAAALNDHALALFQGGLVTEAGAAWLRALALDPEHLESALNHALASWRTGRATDGELLERFESMRAARNDAWPTVYALGLLHLERRDLALASRLLEEASRRSGRSLDFESLLRRAMADGSAERVAECRVDQPPAFPLPIALAAEASLLLVGEGGDVALRRPQDLAEVARLCGHRGSVRALAVTPEGRIGLSGADDGTLLVWDLQSRRLRQRLEDPDLGPLLGVALSADGRRAVTIGLDPAFHEARRRQAEAIGRWHQENEGCILPEEIPEERVVHAWLLESGECRVLERGADAAAAVRLSTDGERLLAMGDRHPRFRMFDVVSGRASPIDGGGAVLVLAGSEAASPTPTLPEEALRDGRFAITRDGRRAAWAQPSLRKDGEYEHALVFYDTVAGRCLRTIVLEQGVDAVQLSGDGTLAITAANGAVEAWRLPARWDSLVELQPSSPASARAVPVAGASASELQAQAREALARRDFRGALELLSALRQLPGHERTESSCAAWATLYRSCTRTALRSTWVVREVETASGTLVCLSPDGSAIARTEDAAPTWGAPARLRVLLEDPRSGRPRLGLEGTVDRPGSLDFSANARFLAAGGYASIVVWDLATGRQQAHPVRFFDSIRGLRIGDDGRHALFSSLTGPTVWDGTDALRPGSDPMATALARDVRSAVADGRWRFEVEVERGLKCGPLWLVDEHRGARRVLVPGGVISAEVSRDGQWLLTIERSSAGSHRRGLRVRFLDWDLAAGDAPELPPPRTFPGAGAPTSRHERWIAYEDRRGAHRRHLDVGEWVVGRAPDCDIVIDDFALSRRHAKLVADGETVHIVDLQSKGGTQVNGVPVREGRLAGGDRLRLGQFQIRYLDGSETPAPEDVEASTVQPAPPDLGTAAAPEAWRHAAPDRRALIRRIEAIATRPPQSLDEASRLGELGDSFLAIMYVVEAIQGECAVKLPSQELMRINTVGELVDLVCNAPKVPEG